MVIDFYENTVPKGRLFTSLSQHKQLTGFLREQCSIEDPVIHVEYDPYIFTVNYAYIADFGRYYRITGRVIDGDTVHISLHVDALNTYRSVILNSQCIAERSSSRYSLGLQDSFVKAEQGYRYNFSKFPYTFGSHASYVLAVTGGDSQ